MEHFARCGYEEARAEEIAAEAGCRRVRCSATSRPRPACSWPPTRPRPGPSPPTWTRRPGPRGGLLRGPAVLDRPDPAPHPRGLDPLPGHADRQLLPGLQLAPRDHPVPGQRGPVRDAGFVRFGIDRGEVRQDIDPRMIVSMVDWLMDRVQDAMVTEELDPGLFGTHPSADERERRVNEFLELLRSAVGPPGDDRRAQAGRPAAGRGRAGRHLVPAGRRGRGRSRRCWSTCRTARTTRCWPATTTCTRTWPGPVRRGAGGHPRHRAQRRDAARGEYTETEQRDAEAVIAWLAAQPWCTGAVGM